MDFESYIARERQLISRLDRERKDSNSYERRADVGNYELAEDEIRLLKAGEYVMSRSEAAVDAVLAVDERLAELHRMEDEAISRNAEFLRKVTDWETMFDKRYTEIMDRIATENASLATRTEALKTLVQTAEMNIKQVSETAISEVRQTSETTAADIKATCDTSTREIKASNQSSADDIRQISEAAAGEIRRMSEELKAAQAAFDEDVGDKLARDKETVERIKHIMKQMNEMIKI